MGARHAQLQQQQQQQQEQLLLLAQQQQMVVEQALVATAVNEQVEDVLQLEAHDGVQQPPQQVLTRVIMI